MRRAILIVSTLLVAYALCELAVFALLALAGGPDASPAGIAQRRAQIASTTLERQWNPQAPGVSHGVVLHPYLGYVLDARKAMGTINSYGFRGDETFPKGALDITVLLTGGSGAEHLHGFSADVVRDELARIPAFAGRRVHVVSAAVWAWKQPQQLLAVAYYLAQGGKIDLLINLDGYNEVGNAANQRRYARGTMYPAYPSPGLWTDLTATLGDPAMLAVAGEVTLLRRARQQLARGFGIVSWSVTGGALWDLLDRALEQRIAARLGVPESRGDETRMAWFRTGPTNVVPPAEAQEFSSQLWFDSSRQLARLATANGFAYFHFLQPSLFLEGTKPLSAAEQKLRGDPDAPNASFVRRGYPRLRELGAQLRAEGVAFHDLSNVFSDVHETLYTDNCCHFSDAGNDLLARRIAAVIARELKPQ